MISISDIRFRYREGDFALRIEDLDYRVVGVMAPWRPSPKFYDTTNNTWEAPEAVFMPFVPRIRPLAPRFPGV